jgi:hypothetical protein
MPLGIMVDKELQKVDRVFIPIFRVDDTFLIDYAQKLIHNNRSQVTVLDINSQVRNNYILQNAIRALEQDYPNQLGLMNERIMKSEFLQTQDLMIISLESWKALVDTQSPWLSKIPSALIIKP